MCDVPSIAVFCSETVEFIIIIIIIIIKLYVSNETYVANNVIFRLLGRMVFEGVN